MGNAEQRRSRGRRFRKKNNGPAIAFFIALGLLTALAWCLPLRPSVSEKEKRNLEPFPDFSVSSLLDGSYFEDKYGLPVGERRQNPTPPPAEPPKGNTKEDTDPDQKNGRPGFFD